MNKKKKKKSCFVQSLYSKERKDEKCSNTSNENNTSDQEEKRNISFGRIQFRKIGFISMKFMKELSCIGLNDLLDWSSTDWTKRIVAFQMLAATKAHTEVTTWNQNSVNRSFKTNLTLSKTTR